MCSRYTIIGTRLLAERFGGPVLPPRYNAAPGQQLPVIRGDQELISATFGIMRRDGIRRINARVEGVITNATAIGEPCVIPADGFYEWKQEGKRRQPYYFFFPDSDLVSFAGIFDEKTTAFCIITRPSIDPVSRIHQRMPYVLSPGREVAWMGNSNLVPSEERIDMAPVSRRINDPTAYDDPSLIEPPMDHDWW